MDTVDERVIRQFRALMRADTAPGACPRFTDPYCEALLKLARGDLPMWHRQSEPKLLAYMVRHEREESELRRV